MEKLKEGYVYLYSRFSHEYIQVKIEHLTIGDIVSIDDSNKVVTELEWEFGEHIGKVVGFKYRDFCKGRDSLDYVKREHRNWTKE